MIEVQIAALLIMAFVLGFGLRALLDMARQARDARLRLERANDSRCPECGQYPRVPSRGYQPGTPTGPPRPPKNTMIRRGIG